MRLPDTRFGQIYSLQDLLPMGGARSSTLLVLFLFLFLFFAYAAACVPLETGGLMLELQIVRKDFAMILMLLFGCISFCHSNWQGMPKRFVLTAFGRNTDFA